MVKKATTIHSRIARRLSSSLSTETLFLFALQILRLFTQQQQYP
jgi:hypothetical protein